MQVNHSSVAPVWPQSSNVVIWNPSANLEAAYQRGPIHVNKAPAIIKAESGLTTFSEESITDLRVQ